MSTRGAVGIRFNNVDKIGYNHFDSYPSGLGDSILMFLKDKSIEELKELYNKIELCENSSNDVWDFLHNKINEIFPDCSSFMYDSLFCEYAYIINLDEGVLEYYRGFNKDKNASGRYAFKSLEEPYYGVALKNSIPLTEVFSGKFHCDNF